MEHPVYYTFEYKLVYPGLRLVLIAGLLALGWGAMAAGYAYVISGLTALTIGVVFLRRLIPFRGGFRPRSREMVSFSAPLLLSGLAGVLLLNADTVLLGYFRTNSEVAFYDVAYPLANGLLLFMNAFGFFYLPLTSRLDSQDRTSEVDAIYKLSTKWIYLLTFPMFLLLFTFPSDVLRIIFQPEYTAAWPALAILALGFFAQAGSGRCFETLSAFGHTRTLFVINIGTFLLNLGLNLLLIPRYGFVAAAATSAVSFTVQNVLTIGVLWYRFGITPFAPMTVRTFLALPLVLVPLSAAVSYVIALSLLSFVAMIVLLPVASLAVYLLAGCAEPQDRIIVDLVESKTGRSLPLADRLLPARDD